jgi:hypothetical protein
MGTVSVDEEAFTEEQTSDDASLMDWSCGLMMPKLYLAPPPSSYAALGDCSPKPCQKNTRFALIRVWRLFIKYQFLEIAVFSRAC